MAIAVPPAGAVPERYTVEGYFQLVDGGILGPDDQVELLEGVVVNMAPEGVRHAAAIMRVGEALREAIAKRAVVSEQHPFIAGAHSAPQTDVAVIPGRVEDYDTAHARSALLIVEASHTSLVQDRLTKAAIYAAAAVPEYWIVNLRDDHLELFRGPDSTARTYRERRVVSRDEDVELAALPGVRVRVRDLLPRRSE
ncbi:MAG TPA: Uma2 family endonuclease [Candidatus Binatia bacterium]|nr:Uma2 family endonuclease [Candidatus Binatia bacterium]